VLIDKEFRGRRRAKTMQGVHHHGSRCRLVLNWSDARFGFLAGGVRGTGLATWEEMDLCLR
jgi:hypothetical protein